MVALVWDKTGERLYETGVDHGVLFQLNNAGDYDDGVAWNGLTTVTESPSGAEANPQYADNIKYLNLMSAEEFSCTIEAFTYPTKFEQNDGSASPVAGVVVTQQRRRTFGFSYRTLIGNDINGQDHGFKIHLVYGCLAAPSEKARNTINDSPEATPFSWEVTTTPVEVGEVDGVMYKPSAHLIIDSTTVDEAKLADFLELLYGTAGTDPVMPLPADVIAMLGTVVSSATPAAPTYDNTDDMITIPNTAGVEYLINGVVVPAGDHGPITSNTEVRARPATGYKFPVPTQTQWVFTFA